MSKTMEWEVTEELVESVEIQILSGILGIHPVDCAEEYLAWQRWLEYSRPERAKKESIYHIARFLKKPVTPPDLSAALPSRSKILRESDLEKSQIVVKSDTGHIAYIVWGVVVFGNLPVGCHISHIIKVG